MTTRPALERNPTVGLANATRRMLRMRLWRTLVVCACAVTLVALAAFTVARGGAPASELTWLKQQMTSLAQKVAKDNPAQFPATSVEGAAYQLASLCSGWSDQDSDGQILAVTNRCGWNGIGQADRTLLFWDQSPQLAKGVTHGAYSALPFGVQFSGSQQMLHLWVPVHMRDDTPVTIGFPAFLNVAPTFVVNGCTQDPTAAASDPRIQAVNGLVRDVHGYAMPGRTMNLNGAGLSDATAGSAFVCEGSGPVRLVLAPVTFKGPTPGATYTEGLAFRTIKISTGEIRVEAIGIDTSWTPNSALT